MNLAPNTAEIFSEEYWGTVSPKQELGNSRERIFTRSFFDTDTQASIEESLNVAFSNIASGESTEVISEGEIIGGPKDTKYALPGSVILVDKEWVGMKKNRPDGKPESVLDEEEISMSAIACLLKSLREAQSVGPNKKHLLYSYQKSFNFHRYGFYDRDIDLYGFNFDNRGKLVGRAMLSWYANGVNGPEADIINGRFIPASNMDIPVRVGQTLDGSIIKQVILRSRIREARLCIAGIPEFAPERVKKERRVLMPTLACNPS